MTYQHGKAYYECLDKQGLFALMLIGGMVLLDCWLNIDAVFLQARIARALEMGDGASTLVPIFVLKKGLEAVVNYVKSIFVCRLITKIGHSAMAMFFREYISLRYSRFKGTTVGAVHHAIYKRSAAMTQFLSTVFIRFMSDACFLIFVFELIRREIDLATGTKIMMALVSLLLVSGLADRRRAVLRRGINISMENNAAKGLEILMNYERIHAFENFETELEKYSKTMDSQVRYKSIYDITHELLCLFNQLALLFILTLIFYEYNASIHIHGSSVHECILPLIMLSTRMRDIVFDISRDLEKIFISHHNMIATEMHRSWYEGDSRRLKVLELKRSIVFDDVNFALDGGNRLLSGVSVKMCKGDKVAIVGPNGSGKSTFLKLIMGLYEYDGSITVDGIELRNIVRKSVQELMAFVPQSSCLFNKTVLENLRDGNKMLSDEQIIEKAKLYGYNDAFTALGYDKMAGEQGSNLSGGLRQKVCFVRALLSDKPIVLMDRACASMDGLSCCHVERMIHSTMKDKTVINIVDDLSSIGYYDYILFFNDSILQECGPLNELLAKEGRFSHFYREARLQTAIGA